MEAGKTPWRRCAEEGLVESNIHCGIAAAGGLGVDNILQREDCLLECYQGM